jgi:Flp pilus assembly protein TadG
MCKRLSRGRRGAAAVELAVLLSVFLLPLLLGLWEVGRLVEVMQLLDNAAREGGRQASTGRRTVTQVQQSVVNYLARNGITVDPNAVILTNLTSGSRNDPTTGNPSPPHAQKMDHFNLTVTLPFNSVRWVLLNQITNTTQLTASVDWYSMNDFPLTVDTTLPSAPQ